MALQLLQEPTKFDSSSVPPRSVSMRWSASTLGAFLHQWQIGSCSNAMSLFCLNSGVLRLVMVFLCLGDVTSALASLRLLSCVCWSRVFVPPTFHNGLLLAAGLFRVEHQSPFVSLGNAEQ